MFPLAHTGPVGPVVWRRGDSTEGLVDREWLVANALGGYASGTLAGVLTRRYHGLLVAAMPAPLGRIVVLAGMQEEVLLPDGSAVPLAGLEQGSGRLVAAGPVAAVEFRLDLGLPVWTFQVGDHRLERRVVMPHRENAVHVIYRTTGDGAALSLRLRPLVRIRPLDGDLGEHPGPPPEVVTAADGCAIRQDGGLPGLRLRVPGPHDDMAPDVEVVPQSYPVEARRGYASEGTLFGAGVATLRLTAGVTAAVVAEVVSAEAGPAADRRGRPAAGKVAGATPAPSHADPNAVLVAEERRRRALLAAAPDPLREGRAAALVLAADQFLVTLPARQPTAAPAPTAPPPAAGPVWSVIAGYHWFADWGRDTMISLEGLALTTGRHEQARSILRAFAAHVRDGLIPNLFPEGAAEGLYHTADATLWFFHALHRTLRATGDRALLRELLPALRDIVAWHVRGTDFGIAVDPADSLLHQGAPGYQLTWMDAKVDGWVVTPRRGKAVEIQALWYQALRLLAGWVRDEIGDNAAREYDDRADTVRRSFGARFWYEAGGHLYDVVDGEGGDDASLRPNQVLALSLDHVVLAPERWRPVLDTVTAHLLTPLGLRSLAPGSPGYTERYDGDLRSRDAAYHQGTVWGWLIGPYVDAWVRVHGDAAAARPLLDGLLGALDRACMGQLAEIFDAVDPHTPRGCIAQAWTVAEVLRCLAMTGDITRP